MSALPAGLPSRPDGHAKEFKYRDQRVAVTTHFIGGGWHWFYEVDGGLPVITLGGALASLVEVAERAAKQRIQIMPKQSP